LIIQTFSKFRNKSKTTPLLLVALFCLVALCLSACSNEDEAPDVSRIKTDVTIHRFDRDFFLLDTTQLPSSLARLKEKYPAFLPLYFEFFAPVRDIAQQQNIPFEEALLQYYRFIKPLYNAVDKKYGNLTDVEEGLEKNLRYVKHYFPAFETPVVLTSVESLNPENPDEIHGTTYYQDTLIISLQMFLGKDYEAYDPTRYPDYLRRRFEPEFIVPNSLRAIANEIYRDTSESGTLVEQMIEKGKQWWLLKKFLPNMPDSLITGYTAHQTKWVIAEEGNIWGYINQNENLFSVEQAAIQTYIGQAPFTQTLPHGDNGQGAPGNIGPWIGLRILQKFEERNKKLTVEQILRTPARRIFDGAKYKPKS
jgi:hypothetical protein